MTGSRPDAAWRGVSGQARECARGWTNKLVRAGWTLVLPTVLLAACASSDATATPSPEPASTSNWPPQTYNLKDVTISLERRGCFGTCPVYSVTIFGDGRVEYDGVMHVAAHGLRASSIDNETLGDLVDDFYDAHFFDMREEYMGHRDVSVDDDTGLVEESVHYVTCGPSSVISIRIGEFEKSVINEYGAPQALDDLAGKIDSMSGAAEWVGDAWSQPPLAVYSPSIPEEFAPLRTEQIQDTHTGPRLAISELGDDSCHSFGDVIAGNTVDWAMVVTNVGDQDLQISRVYSGCPWVSVSTDDGRVAHDGILADAIRVAPSSSAEISVELAADTGPPGSPRLCWLQVFTSDRSYPQFSEDDPSSHETRLCLTYDLGKPAATP